MLHSATPVAVVERQAGPWSIQMIAESLGTHSVLTRLGVTLGAALVFGLSRQRFGKPIGFGPFTLVASGSCGLSITAVNYSPDNPLPLLSAIVTSIGFLGAGALLRTGDRIFGFTSAATIWAFAIFGLVVGVGEIGIGLSIYGIIIGVHMLDWLFDRHRIGTAHFRRITLKASPPIAGVEVLRLLNGAGAKSIERIDVNRADGACEFVVLLSGRPEHLDRAMSLLDQDERFKQYRIE